MTFAEAKKILRVSERTLLNLCNQGAFYAVKRNGKWYIPALPISDPAVLPSELSKQSGISHRRIIKLCENGKLPAYKIGKQWRISKVEADKFINRRDHAGICTQEII